MKRIEPTNHEDDRFAAIPAPVLTDEAVIYIHRALENYLHLFEAQYGDQIHRYYQDRAQENLTQSSPRHLRNDEDPF